MLPIAGRLSVKRLRALTRRELVARDAAAAERRRKQAERAADVVVRSIGDGMAELVTTMAAPLSAATFDVVDQYARMAKADGDERTLGQLRSAFLADLALRPWDTSRPPVTAQVTVVAPLPALQQRPGAVLRWTARRSSRHTHASCWSLWRRSARAACRRQPGVSDGGRRGARLGRAARRHDAAGAQAGPPAVAAATIPTRRAPARCSTGPHRSTDTRLLPLSGDGS